VRLRLMSLIASHPGGEACVCNLNDAFDLSQPTISHHLKVLHEAGLVDRDKRGDRGTGQPRRAHRRPGPVTRHPEPGGPPLSGHAGRSPVMSREGPRAFRSRLSSSIVD